MRVLITGGAGYIGSHTSNLLFEKGYQVTVIDNLSTGFQESLISDIELYKGDICNTEFLDTVLSAQKYDAIIHFAAKLIVPESVIHPSDYYQNNVIGSMNLFLSCIKHGVKKIIFSSTAAVYGESKAEKISEVSSCDPINPYGNSKLFVEKMLLDFVKAYGLQAVILRYFNVAGAAADLKNGQRTKGATHLVKVVAEAANNKRKGVSVFGSDYPTRDGTCVRDYIHVVDLALAHLSALEYLEGGGSSDTFNCGYGIGFSVKDVINTMKKVSGVSFDVLYENRRIGDPAVIIAENSKIMSKLKWYPQYNDLEFICKTAYEWEKSIE